MRLLKINQILRVHLYWLAECISANPGVKKLLSWKHPSLVLKAKLPTSNWEKLWRYFSEQRAQEELDGDVIIIWVTSNTVFKKSQSQLHCQCSFPGLCRVWFAQVFSEVAEFKFWLFGRQLCLNKRIIAFVLHNNPCFHFYSCIMVFHTFYSAWYWRRSKYLADIFYLCTSSGGINISAQI